MTTASLVRLEQQGNVLVVSPLFAFGAFSDADLRAEWAGIERRLGNQAIEHVTINLSEVPYFGSNVPEWMVLIWKRIRARGGRLVVCHCSDIGRDILRAARFDTLWTICNDRARALATLV